MHTPSYAGHDDGTYPRAQPVTMTRLPLAGSGATRRVERITKTTHKLGVVEGEAESCAANYN